MTAPSCGAVTIAAKPSECCQVGKGAVANKKEDAVNVTDKGDGSYTFTMRDSKVGVGIVIVPEQQRHPFGGM